LDLTLSDAEQKSFFAKWGDDIQSVIATGFQRIERQLERILFLQETRDVLSHISVRLELDRAYSANEIGHFRAFCSIHLKEPKFQIWEILFGSTDKSAFQWEKGIDLEEAEGATDETKSEYKSVGGGSGGIDADTVHFIFVRYTHDIPLLRYLPRLVSTISMRLCSY
jgi:hypothetical protein